MDTCWAIDPGASSAVIILMLTSRLLIRSYPFTSLTTSADEALAAAASVKHQYGCIDNECCQAGGS